MSVHGGSEGCDYYLFFNGTSHPKNTNLTQWSIQKYKTKKLLCIKLQNMVNTGTLGASSVSYCELLFTHYFFNTLYMNSIEIQDAYFPKKILKHLQQNSPITLMLKPFSFNIIKSNLTLNIDIQIFKPQNLTWCSKKSLHATIFYS